MAYLTNRSSNWILYTLPGAAIILGASVYLFLRPGELLYHQWARSTGLDAVVSLLRPENPNVLSSLPTWTLYSLPGALWAFAYALIITRLWMSKKHWIKYLWLSTIPLLVLGFEVLQYPGILPGTFSIPDLLTSLFGSAVGIFIGITSRKRFNHENIIH